MKKVLICILLLILGAAGGAGGLYLYQQNSYEETVIEESKFPKNTKIKINDWETYASYETAEDMYNDYIDSCEEKDYKFEITLKENKYTLDLNECYNHTIKVEDFEKILKEITLEDYMQKDSFEFKLEDSYECDVEKTKNIFLEFLKNTTYEYVEPKDAVYDPENYEIIPGVDGTKVIEEKALVDFEKAIKDEVYSLNLDNENYFEKAKVQTADLEKQYGKLIAIANWKATYTVSDYVIQMKDYMDYLTKNEDGTFTIDTSFMKDAVLALSKTIDKWKAHDRQFNSTLDGIITVTSGTYNQIMNNDEEIKYLIEKLNNGESCENREPIWKVKPVPSGQEKTYVEVDLSAQHVWYYVDGVLTLEADCVTGTDNTSRETPTGSFYISQKIEGTYLTGPTWRSWVDKWMRVNNDGIGLHDASWRKEKEFGGNTYKKNGSHGCINLPKQFAYDLYDKVEIGTLVIIHE